LGGREDPPTREKGTTVAGPSWQWDENIQRGTDYASREVVRAYDEHMGSVRDIRGEIERILAYLELSPDDRVLEMGAGTGFFSRAAARRCRQVISVDISEAMLAYGAERACEEGIDNVVFRLAGFLTYEHEGDPLAAVVSQLALHHLPDAWKFVALRRLSQFMRPQGKLFLSDVVYHDEMDSDPFGYLQKLIDSWPEDVRAAMVRHVGHEYSTFDWTMREILARAGFVVERVEPENRVMTHYLCTRT
jgi:putative AdoMet-dependent methyltransferase